MLAIARSDWLISLQTTGLPPAWRTGAQLAYLIAQFDLVFLNRDVVREATDCRSGAKQLTEAATVIGECEAAHGDVQDFPRRLAELAAAAHRAPSDASGEGSTSTAKEADRW